MNHTAVLRSVTWLIAAWIVVTPCFADASAHTSKTVFIVRHAEKESSEERDPDLSSAGLRRAELLKNMLSSARLSAVFASQYKRTAQTVAPSAVDHHIEVKVVDAMKTGKLAEAIRSESSGANVLVAGHSNTVPALLRELGISEERIPEIKENDYDNLFVVVLGAKAPTLVHLQIKLN